MICTRVISVPSVSPCHNARTLAALLKRHTRRIRPLAALAVHRYTIGARPHSRCSCLPDTILNSTLQCRQTKSSMATCAIVSHIVEDDGQFPNCSIQKLPLLIYKSAFESTGNPSQLANHIESIFEKNGFPPQWRFGLYDYPHYHSTSHEILGVFQGSACVRYPMLAQA